MPVVVVAPLRTSMVEVQPLSQHSFAEFGTVIENPQQTREPSTTHRPLPATAVIANQGTAVKYQDVTTMVDLYSSAPSRAASRAVMNMFVCAPRSLNQALGQESSANSLEGTFPVEILERHPFTTQTFIPLGLSAAEQEDTRYLVIVAPTNPPSAADNHFPAPQDGSISHTRYPLPGRGLPNLTNLRAYIAKGTQAVTYGVGTWHAPMVVVGKKPIEFVVIQFSNGVEIEDCQEVTIRNLGDQATIRVAVRSMTFTPSQSGSPKL